MSMNVRKPRDAHIAAWLIAPLRDTPVTPLLFALGAGREFLALQGHNPR